MPKPRNPRKLLGRLSIILFGTAASTAVHPRKGDPQWRAAATAALDDVAGVIEKHFPDHAKR